MKHNYEDMDEWLRDRIDEDLMAMADEREKLLMESEEFQNIEMPMERLEDIQREIEARKRATKGIRIRRRAAIALAAAAISCVGIGLAGSGSRLYRPEVVEREVGNDVVTKVNNADVEESEYDEETVCRELEEKLGVISVRFSYRPDRIYLSKYWVGDDEKSALLNYEINGKKFYVYISKNHKDSGINSRMNGKEIGSLTVKSCGLDIKVLEYQELQTETYYSASFEYLNTYYSFSGAIDREEFIKILEYLTIKNI